MAGRYILGLDIGTTKVCGVVAKVEGDDARIIGAGTVPSRGVKKGVVVDMDAATDAIREAVTLAEESSGVELNAAYIGVAGSHVSCQDSYGATGIRGKKVTQRDIDRVIDSASTVYVPLDREVLHVLPTDYAIDGQGDIQEPLGMSGVRLEAGVRVVTASQAAVENLTRCCREAGIEVVDAVFEPIASCYAVLRPYEMRSGVAVVDIGGGTTDVAVYKDGGLRHASVLPVGGEHLTNDLAIGLKVSPEEAEEVKKHYGYAIHGPAGPRDFEVTDADGSRKTLPGRYLGEILLPRCEEIFELIGTEIRKALLFSSSSCVVITGGTALLKGMDRVAEAKLGLPVRIGLPENGNASACWEILKNPAYSTAVGLMLYGFEEEGGIYEDIFQGLYERFAKLKERFQGVRSRVSRPGKLWGKEIHT